MRIAKQSVKVQFKCSGLYEALFTSTYLQDGKETEGLIQHL